MEIKTKYDIGDLVQYQRNDVKQGQKDKKIRCLGEIVGVSFSKTLRYVVRSGLYAEPQTVDEKEILHKLAPVLDDCSK